MYDISELVAVPGMPDERTRRQLIEMAEE